MKLVWVLLLLLFVKCFELDALSVSVALWLLYIVWFVCDTPLFDEVGQLVSALKHH